MRQITIGFHKVTDGRRAYVNRCPSCRLGEAHLWVMTDVGTLTGARFEACEGCAESIAHIVLHTFALMSAGVVRVISDTQGK